MQEVRFGFSLDKLLPVEERLCFFKYLIYIQGPYVLLSLVSSSIEVFSWLHLRFYAKFQREDMRVNKLGAN